MSRTSTPHPADVAWRAALQSLVPLTVAAVVVWKDRTVAGGALSVIGVVVLASGLFLPSLFLKLERGGRWLGHAAGISLTWLLLVPMFYLVFLPGRLILILTRRDPMARKFPTTESTYWIPRKPVANPDDYKRQF